MGLSLKDFKASDFNVYSSSVFMDTITVRIAVRPPHYSRTENVLPTAKVTFYFPDRKVTRPPLSEADISIDDYGGIGHTRSLIKMAKIHILKKGLVT